MTIQSTPADKPQTVMGFDFGTQKMGLAVGNALVGSAQPLALFSMRDGIPNWDALEKVIAEWQPDTCIVGLPLNMDNSESELSLRARKFARRLKHRINKPVWMVDERLSTRDARGQLADFHHHGQAKNLSADSIAAMLFVESWFRDHAGVLP